MKKIDGTPRNLMGLLQNTKYTVNYYQREYRWQRRQIEELINDLTTEFLRNYQLGHKRDDVADYDIYFMGSIILAGRENSIVDGQQRLSSLTLLLMYLHNKLKQHNKHHPTIEQIIYSEVRGKKSFNINVTERQACMTVIFNNKLDDFDATDATESVKNLCKAYEVIKDNFSQEINDDALLIFCDWLIEKVYFIEIVAQEEQDASKIFITMNDRGLNLTPVEMLKSYLLSEIKSNTARDKLNKLWKKKIDRLKRDDVKGDEVFIKAWLRAQYADIQIIKENTSTQMNLFGDEPLEIVAEKFSDFETISGEFHKWVRDNHRKLNLNTTYDYERFIEEFVYFVGVYFQIRTAEKIFANDTKYIYYNAQLNFTLQPLLLMAPICPNDNAETVTKKFNLAARFIDLWINTRVTSRKSLNYNTIQNYIFKIAKDIRGCSIEELKIKLKSHYDTLNYQPATVIYDFTLNKSNKRYVKNILARITSFIEEKTSGTPHYVDYMTTTADFFEIEHILCDHFERFTSDFADKNEFDDWRDSIGALLLLRKSINSSLSDSDYSQKIVKYCSTDGNIYAASLGAQTYQNNPRFKKFVTDNNLTFEPFDKFGKAEIQKRTALIIQLVNLIWNAEEFND